jgi:hypothetical protein
MYETINSTLQNLRGCSVKGVTLLNIKKRLLRLVLIGLLAFTSNGAFAHGVVISNLAINGKTPYWITPW